MLFQKITITSTTGLFWFEPHTPLQNSLPFGILNDVPWGGYGHFLEPQNILL